MRYTTPYFEVDRIDFQVKRLGLTHNPKVQHTIQGAGNINEISQQILKFKKSLTPKSRKKSA